MRRDWPERTCAAAGSELAESWHLGGPCMSSRPVPWALRVSYSGHTGPVECNSLGRTDNAPAVGMAATQIAIHARRTPLRTIIVPPLPRHSASPFPSRSPQRLTALFDTGPRLCGNSRLTLPVRGAITCKGPRRLHMSQGSFYGKGKKKIVVSNLEMCL